MGIVLQSEAAEYASAQLLCATLTNLLARFVRTIHFTVPEISCRLPQCGGEDLYDHLSALAVRIDPFITLVRDPGVDVFTIGVGSDLPRPADVYVFADGWQVQVGRLPISCSWSADPNPLGPLFAACLGVSEVFKAVTAAGISLESASITIPEVLGANALPLIREDPIELGSILQVGAGAVGSAVAFTLGLLPVSGTLRIVDPDIVKIHDLNRSPLFEFSHAEIDEYQGGTPKVDVAADYLSGARLEVTTDNRWYDELFDDKRPAGFDVWLPLANERRVRRSMQLALAPLMLHATTTQSWGVNLHRHIYGVDDCLVCRIRDDQGGVAALGCATGTIEVNEETSIDAALPFQSTAAGVLLAASLVLLASAGEVVPDNYFEMNFRPGKVLPQTLHRRCLPACQSPAIAGLAGEYNQGTRYHDVWAKKVAER